jgi:pterin-4a-carbinolamine dehydratase
LTLDEYAEANRLTFEVFERASSASHLPRFYVHFKDVKIERGFGYVWASGNADTVEDAKVDYAGIISRRRLFVDYGGGALRKLPVAAILAAR